jgi:heat shock protein HslJ
MKARTFISMMVMLITMVSMTACENEDNPVDIPVDNKIIGTWSLYGFGTIGEDKVQEVNDKLEKWWLDKRFTLVFMGDGTLKGQTWANEVLGEYKIHGNIIEFANLRTTLMAEQNDGEKYYNALLSVTHFEIKGDQLLLYYNDQQNYLLFDNVEKILEE